MFAVKLTNLYSLIRYDSWHRSENDKCEINPIFNLLSDWIYNSWSLCEVFISPLRKIANQNCKGVRHRAEDAIIGGGPSGAPRARRQRLNLLSQYFQQPAINERSGNKGRRKTLENHQILDPEPAFNPFPVRPPCPQLTPCFSKEPPPVSSHDLLVQYFCPQLTPSPQKTLPSSVLIWPHPLFQHLSSFDLN